jgi:hypothetical protein
MEEFSFSLCVTPVFHPIQPISQAMDGFFSIHFIYTNSTFSTTSNVTNPLTNFRTNIDDHFLIPSEILCICDTNTIINVDQNTLFLYNNFNFVPSYVLDTILCQMGDCARQMIALNVERCGILKMNVLFHVTSYLVDEYQFDQYLDGNDE